MIKSTTTVFLGCILVALAPSSAGAKSPFGRYSGAIKVTASATNSGPCSTSFPLANRCPSGGIADCLCVTFSGSYSGAAGKGTATGAYTLDFDAGVPTIGNGAAIFAGCSPANGVIQIAGAKDTETFAIAGGGCLGVSDVPFFAGGCTLVTSDVFVNGAVVGCTTVALVPGGKIVLKGVSAK